MARELDRRTFLRQCTIGACGVGSIIAFGDLVHVHAVSDGQPIPLARAIILVDKTLCSGCRTCEMACSNFNAAGQNSYSHARIMLEKEYIEGNYQPKACYHCADPPCLKACPVGAIHVDRSSGTFARITDEEKCIGCEECVQACGQFFRPSRSRFDPEKEKAFKCHLCFGDPQCVKMCPYGALKMERSEMGFLVGYPVIKGD